MITWDAETEARNRKHEIQIAIALLNEATRSDDVQAIRRLQRAAAMHLEPLAPHKPIAEGAAHP